MSARRCPPYAAVLALLALLLAQPAAAQLVLRSPTLALNPAQATSGGTISAAGTSLPDGDYAVVLVAGQTRHPLAAVAGGEGSFQRTVTVPTLARGSYTVELVVNGRVEDTASLSVVPPLSLSLPAEATAGSTIAFSVGGLVAGSLSLQYDGATIYGPVQVAAGSHAGKLRLPLDRPATLPANVAVKARNSVGRTVPRVGTRSLPVERPDSSPFVRLLGGSSSDPTPRLRERFQVSGSVATNEAHAADVEMRYFWKGADGSVVPMGTAAGAVAVDGSFAYDLLLPHAGTQSATNAGGAGQVMAVSHWQDQHGVIQQKSEVVDDLAAPIVDTDAAIDLTVVLRGNDNLAVEGARIDLVDADLDQLYNSNEGGVRMDGALQAGLPTQFAQPSDEVLGCPANRERQYSNAVGRAEFEFDLSLPARGYNVDGSGPPPQVTIQPTEDCVPSGSINTPGWCQEVDLAGVHFTALVRAAHTGYGYVEELVLADGQRRLRELPVRLNARIDRYTGRFDLETCIPGQACTEQTFEGSALRTLVLPKLPQQGLLLADPSFKASTGHRLAYAQGHQAGTDPVRFRPLVDLTPLQAETFVPGTPPGWSIEVNYDAGAGAPLQSVTLLAPGVEGASQTSLHRSSGAADCDVGGTETWVATLPAKLARGMRFPRTAWGDVSNATLWVLAVDTEGKSGVRQLRFSFADLEPSLAALAGTPGLQVIARDPHVHRLELGARAVSGATTSPPEPEYDVGRKDNRLEGSTEYELCAPTTADCGAVNAAGFGHQQFSRSPATQPAPEVQAGGGKLDGGTEGWTVLFDKTIPLFRWYWGIPELISAEVFADLGIKAEHLLDVVFDPAHPGEAFARAGGRLGLLIMIGVDIDVLFGILVDAGAAISGIATSEIVATGGLQGTSVDECFTFSMNFDGWLEIGCPVPNPFDPTCYIPDLETHYPIIQAQDGSGCPAQKAALLQRLARITGPATDGLIAPPPPSLLVRAFRSQLQRRPAIAVDHSGERMLLSIESQPDDSAALVARVGMGRSFSAPVVVSAGYGIRDTAVTWFAGGHALAVWSQTNLPPHADPGIANAARAARHQVLHYAVWDGESWSAPAVAAKGGLGDGHVRLARCRGLLLFRGACSQQKVTMVFQRNLDGDIAGRKGIFLSHFNGSAWSALQRVDQSGDYNITPALAYDGSTPVVAWVRHDPGAGLDAVDARRLALRRFDGRGAEEVPAGLPNRVAQPVLAAGSGGLALAFTRAAPGDAFIGTRQAMHLGHRSCSSCGFSSWQVEDVHGRAVYGERPSLLLNAQGEAVLTFRGLGFGPRPGSADPEDNLLPGDPLGMVATTGELVQVRSPLQKGRATLLALTNDGGWHAQPVSAMDDSTGQVVALSMRVDAAAQVAKSARPEHAGKAMAVSGTVVEGLVLAEIADLPDLALSALSTSAKRLDPGARLAVAVDVANLGSGWLPDETRQAWLRLWWDTPETRATLAARLALPAMDGGATRRYTVEVQVPAEFGSDERQTLRAEILVEGGDGELDGSNNQAALAIGGMPVPESLLAVSAPGTRTVNLAWSAPADARIAGYRIYMDGPDGTPLPLGSSFQRGFADLTALYGRARSYRVSSYSARGIESELSEAITAEPMPALLDTGVFRDSFETES